MNNALDTLEIETNAPIRTSFAVGGRADKLARPRTTEQLQACCAAESELRVLGQGANLLVDDAGVAELVVSLDNKAWREVVIDESTGRVRAGAGADLPKLIHATVRAGLTGLEGLIGIPATVGGAVVMNAGGSFGQIADSVARVKAVTRSGDITDTPRSQIGYTYRRSGLFDRIVTEVEFALVPGDPEIARERLKEAMAIKAKTQPLTAKTCGCVFRNPVLKSSIEGVGEANERVSAGKLIDMADGKQLAHGACRVSERHANFIETAPGATASDILHLVDAIKARVHDRFDVTLETEVVIWRRRP